MDRIPSELLFALLFGAILLVQYLLGRLRRPEPLAEAEVRAEPEAERETDPYSAARWPAAAELALPVLAVPARPAPPRAAPTPARREARRFSRRSLMGSRRAVQDAIVIAAILGPCRAYRPHDIE